MRARVVIGANFGDEGKGLFTDYLCATEGADVVVRFNGGAQAGHTVVNPSGDRHVFGHFGSGSFCGIPTYLSEFFVCNPILFFQELDKLHALGLNPSVFAHPSCLVTTFADMIINQRLEDQKGGKRHGSCGIGFGETIERSGLDELKITMADLWNGARLDSIVEEICGKYAMFRTGSEIVEPEMIEAFLKGCDAFAGAVNPLGIEQCKDPVFEGAQGLLLDQNNKSYFPHVTRSSTGIKNVMALCAPLDLKHVETYYISRSYLNRHGAGYLPKEDVSLQYEDKTNVSHDYQGAPRYAPLDHDDLLQRCREDSGAGFKVVMTHCDQESPGRQYDYLSYGETRGDVASGGVESRLTHG